VRLAAATREEKDKRSKRIRVETGFMLSKQNRKDEWGELESSNPHGIYWDLSETRKAAAWRPLLTRSLRLANSGRTQRKV